MEFKIGDEVRILKSVGCISNHFGEVGIITSFSNEDRLAQIEFKDGNGYNGYTGIGKYTAEIELVKGGKKLKIIPVEHHLVVEDSCKNIHGGINDNYKEAEDAAKAGFGDMTIYKLVEVAKVKSERKIIFMRRKVVKKKELKRKKKK